MTGKVLLTGASGFIATHTLDVLVKRGYSVVATVRTQDKADFIKKSYPNAPIEVAFVPDIAVDGAFDKVVQDPKIEYVLHTASPFFFSPYTDPKKEILDPAINGTVGILKAIKAHAPQVKHVVITSSFAAIGSFPPKQGQVFTEKSWNPVTFEDSVSHPDQTYRGSKTLAERALWDFIEKEKPNFSGTAVNPPYVFGPVIHHVKDAKALNTSNQIVYGLLHADPKDNTRPESQFSAVVDVRDVAEAHVLAIEKTKESSGKRWFVTSGQLHWQEILDIINADFPQLQGKVKKGVPFSEAERKEAFAKNYIVDNSVTNKETGLKYHTFKQTIDDTTASLLKLDESWGVSK